MGRSENTLSNRRLFIDSSKKTKCVILLNENKYGRIPIWHSTKIKEEYETISLVLKKNYDKHRWIIGADLKMTNFLDIYKISFFLFVFGTTERKINIGKQEINLRDVLIEGQVNVINYALVEWEKIIFPPLGLMK